MLNLTGDQQAEPGTDAARVGLDVGASGEATVAD